MDVARRMIEKLYVKVDESMSDETVKIGGTISILATVLTIMISRQG